MLQKNYSIQKQSALFLILLVSGLVISLFAGCSDNNNSTGPGGNPGTNEVWIQSNAYDPSTITVTQGTTITWKNKDSVNHTVTSDVAGLFGSGTLGNNATYAHAFDSVGTFAYHCTFHSNMHGTTRAFL